MAALCRVVVVGLAARARTRDGGAAAGWIRDEDGRRARAELRVAPGADAEWGGRLGRYWNTGRYWLLGWVPDEVQRARVLAGTMAYWLALDENLYSNHAYLLVLVAFLLVLADAGATLSLDSRLGWKTASTIPNWPLTLIRIQVSLMYLFTGLAKLNAVFLSGQILEADSRLPALIGTGYGLSVARVGVWLLGGDLPGRERCGPPVFEALLFSGGWRFTGAIVLLIGEVPVSGTHRFRDGFSVLLSAVPGLSARSNRRLLVKPRDEAVAGPPRLCG